MPKKKFIDKKKSVTFHIVPRSQRDPLINDENAPQNVLVPAKKNKEEEQKYGIYFDDDYNYLQHLRDVEDDKTVWIKDPPYGQNDKSNIKFPSSVFASEVEEDVGLLNKAAPTGLCLDVDPDVVAAMDEDFDYSNEENILEDDFIQLANCPGSEDEYQSDNPYSDNELSDEDNFSREETKSRFTEYSMTSSVVTRNSNLTLLDETFEEMFAEYSDTEIGALDCDQIDGEVDTNSEMFKSALKEFDEEQTENQLLKEKSLVLSSTSALEDDSNTETYLLRIPEKEKWDCESILSTYSNLYNHPQLIKEPPISKISINKKTGMPIESVKLTKKSLAKLEVAENVRDEEPSVISKLSKLTIRDKSESSKDKRDRKKQIKQLRRERRLEKKANANAFKEEIIKLNSAMIENKLRCQGIRL